jgi:hypothetical protein
VLEVQLAAPEPLRLAGHIVVVVPPTVSSNVTSPVGIPAPGAVGATVVEYETDWPYTEGFTVEVGVAVVVEAWFTVCTGLRVPVELRKLPSPL